MFHARTWFAASNTTNFSNLNNDFGSLTPSASARADGGLPRLHLSSLLFGLVLVVLLPTLGLGIAATWYAATGERAAQEGRLRDTAQAVALAVDREISGQIAALTAFATSPAFGPDAASPNLPALYAQARQISAQLGVFISVVDRSGARLMNTRRRLGTPLPPVNIRVVVAEVFATGRPQVSDLTAGSMVGRPIIATAVPVFGANGDVALSVDAGFEVEKLRDLLRAVSVPEGTITAIIDSKGITVARSDALHAAFLGLPANPETIRAQAGQRQGFYRAVARDGMERVNAFQKLDVAPGWTLVVEQPAAAFDAAMRRPVLIFGGGGGLALGLGLLLAWFVARQVLTPVRQLGGYARAVAASNGAVFQDVSAATLPPARVAELEALRRGFATAEAALRHNAAAVLGLFQASPIGIARCDFSGRVREANDTALRLVGATREDLAGGRVRWDELTSPDHKGITEHAIKEALAAPDGRCRPYEKEFIRPDGVRVGVLNSFAILDRVTEEAAVFLLDLTEIRQLDARLAESEARLRLFVDRAPAAIAMFDTQMRYLAVSERYLSDYHLVGETSDSLIGRSQYQIFSGMPEHWPDVHRRVLAGETILAHDDQYQRKDGQTEWVRWEMAPWRKADGSVGGAVLFAEVVTARKKAEAELAESEARWRTLADSHPGFIFESDKDGRSIYTNTQFQNYTGRSPEDLLGSGWLDFVHPADKARVNAVRTDAFRNGSPYELEIRLRGANGAYRWYMGRGVPQRGPDGTIQRWLGAAIDISEIVAAREGAERHARDLEHLVLARTRDLEETQARLAQASKMEALGRLAGGVAHDFNNVLQAVLGGVSMAIKCLRTDPDEAETYLDLVAGATDRGATVTGRLLAFARRGELSAAAIPPAPLLESLAQLLHFTLGPSMTLRVEAEPSLPPLFADIGQLESVLVNLVNNARDALPAGGGTIRLIAEAVDAPGETPADLAPGNYVRLAVADDGIGMSSEILARVSEPFFTTKTKGEGTGLGLSMARGFAEQSGGLMTIVSAPGQGTTVSLWLPVAPHEADRNAPGQRIVPGQGKSAVSEIHVPGRRAIKMLMVDDEPGIRAVFAALLVDLGHVVSEAEDAVSALALLDDGIEVDVLVTDLSMPGLIDGLGLVREARHRVPGLPAILVTGHAGYADGMVLDEVARSGPFAVLRKPISMKILEARIADLLDV